MAGRQPLVERLGLLLDESANHVEVTGGNGGEDVMPGAAFEQQRHDVHRDRARFGNERHPPDHADAQVVSTIVRIGACIEQQADHLDVVAGEVQRAGVVPGTSRPDQRGILVKQGTDGLDIPTLNGIEEAGRGAGVAAIDFRLHRSPTGEAVILRDGEERGGQLCAWIGASQQRETILGGSPWPTDA